MMTQNPESDESSPMDSVARDFLASFVVFLVALPLCMGIAIASGAPPTAGLISGIIGGIVVGLFSGAPLQVSGPAAGLVVVVYEVIQEHGLAGLAIVLMIAGVVQIAAGLLRTGNWFRAVSPAVIHGMLAGIGVLIFASQIHVMLDFSAKANAFENLRSIPHSISQAVNPREDANHHWAAAIGFVTLATIILWKKYAPAPWRLVPGPLLGVLLSAAIAGALGLQVNYVHVEPLVNAFHLPAFAQLQGQWIWGLVDTAIVVALVASAETLLCATALDNMPGPMRPRTNYHRELVAQGIGNVCCGLVGGLPVTGVIVRSATNVEAGARSRMSSVLHGTWLLLLACFFPTILQFIPVASLAAVLVYTGVKLVDIKAIQDLMRQGHEQLAIYAVTVATVVFSDLLSGVLIGILLSAGLLLNRFTYLRVVVGSNVATEPYVLQFHGTATFLRLPQLAAALESVPSDRELLVDLRHLKFVDHACLELLTNWENQQRNSGADIFVDWGAFVPLPIREGGLKAEPSQYCRAS